MNYVGVDVHKKYSVLCALDERGRKLREARVEGNTGCGVAQFFRSLEGPSKAVVEGCARRGGCARVSQVFGRLRAAWVLLAAAAAIARTRRHVAARTAGFARSDCSTNEGPGETHCSRV